MRTVLLSPLQVHLDPGCHHPTPPACTRKKRLFKPPHCPPGLGACGGGGLAGVWQYMLLENALSLCFHPKKEYKMLKISVKKTIQCMSGNTVL